MSCSVILNDYDGIQHDYTRKQGLVWQQVFLPACAPPEWSDRSVLWNAVEENEKTKDSRLAREFVVALPIELTHEEQIELVSDFVRDQFISEGMCADAAIHDTDGHNPHAHIMLTVRPLDKHGKWQYKTEKEYLCIRDGEEKGFTAAEFKTAQAEGWEKQYPYYISKKKKAYLPPSAAEGLERADKHPKSTKYGRQNPIAARWNSEEQLVLWRKAWADVVNLCMERIGSEQRIDHRSNAERGLDEQPTIHEGVTARAMEAKGIVADRCELNRQIKADNALLRKLKASVKKLKEAVSSSIPALVEALESIRDRFILLQYQFIYNQDQLWNINRILKKDKPLLTEFRNTQKQLKAKRSELKSLQSQKKNCSPLNIIKHGQLAIQIATLNEEIEELKTRCAQLLSRLDCTDNAAIKAAESKITELEKTRQILTDRQTSLAGQSTKQSTAYANLLNSIPQEKLPEVVHHMRSIRFAHGKALKEKIKEVYKGKFYSSIWEKANDHADMEFPKLPEAEKGSIQERLREAQSHVKNRVDDRKRSKGKEEQVW